MRFLMSFILGMLPEVLYFTLILTRTKSIKEKRILLFLLIAISYCLCILVQNFKILFYILLIVLIYISLKLVYKKKVQIIDVFIISTSYLWVAILSILLLVFLNKDNSNYWLLYSLDRLFLFIPLIFSKQFNKLYKKYCGLWNRNDKENRPIKSITLRNISLILLNGFIFLLNISIINIINVYK